MTKFLKLFILAFILVVFSVTLDVYGQQQLSTKWHIKTGVSSLYVSNMHGSEFDSAYGFSTEIGYRMSTGFEFGIGFSVANINAIYSDEISDSILPTFVGLSDKEVHHSIRLLLGYHLLLGGKQSHIIGLGSGIMVLGQQRNRYEVWPLAIAQAPDGEIFYQAEIRQFRENQLFGEIGFPLNIEYIFRFTKNLAFGARLEAIFNYNDNFNRFSAGPRLTAFF